jgi:hypothetical protein
LLSNDAGRGRLSPFLVLLGGLNNVTESIYVEECLIDGLDDSCEVIEDDEYLSSKDDLRSLMIEPEINFGA